MLITINLLRLCFICKYAWRWLIRAFNSPNLIPVQQSAASSSNSNQTGPYRDGKSLDGLNPPPSLPAPALLLPRCCHSQPSLPLATARRNTVTPVTERRAVRKPSDYPSTYGLWPSLPHGKPGRSIGRLQREQFTAARVEKYAQKWVVQQDLQVCASTDRDLPYTRCISTSVDTQWVVVSIDQNYTRQVTVH